MQSISEDIAYYGGLTMQNNFANSFKKLPHDYTFGVELEFTGGLTVEETQIYIDQLIEMGMIREGWTVHFDRSVIDEEGKGAEIVSPILRDDEQTEKELKIITKFIRQSGGIMGEKVGGHVHFGLQCLGNNIEEIKNFFKLYTIFEPLLYKLSTGDLNYVRSGCHQYAIPIQNGLVNVIDDNFDNLTELIAALCANVGANSTHYGAYRYYGLNIQRIIEAIRNKPKNIAMEEYLQRIFKGEELYDDKGKRISPTIEMRFRNGSSDADEILSSIRMCGGMFVAAKDKEFKEDKTIKSLYRKAKSRVKYIFDKVLQSNREDPNFRDCQTDEEILLKKFATSIYGNGIIDPNVLREFLRIVAPTMKKEDKEKLINYYLNKVKPTDYKKKSIIERLFTSVENRTQERQYSLRVA